jgi:hypothetical protein
MKDVAVGNYWIRFCGWFMAGLLLLAATALWAQPENQTGIRAKLLEKEPNVASTSLKAYLERVKGGQLRYADCAGIDMDG